MPDGRCKLLVVEVDPEMLDLVREHLEGEGYAVTGVGQGSEAIAFALSRIPAKEGRPVGRWTVRG